ncbi:MAG TPA: SpoIIE family protein phosphatase [bacterium]
MTTIRSEIAEIGVTQARLPGQQRSGDRIIILDTDHGLLIAVIDGLGHGEEAAIAAQTAAAEIIAQVPGTAIQEQVERCHAALRQTRGVVMALASINALTNSVSWLGVGNTMGCVLRGSPGGGFRDEALLQRAGLVGRQLPPLRADTLPLVAGDLIILATDGIHSRFSESVRRDETSQFIADGILASQYAGQDDAAAVVVRYLGRRAGVLAAVQAR